MPLPFALADTGGKAGYGTLVWLDASIKDFSGLIKI